MQRTYLSRVDDLLSKIKVLLEDQAAHKKSLRIGPKGRPNARALWRAMGKRVDPATVQRWLNGERNVEDQDAAEPFHLKPRGEQALRILTGAKDREELEEILNKTWERRRRHLKAVEGHESA